MGPKSSLWTVNVCQSTSQTHVSHGEVNCSAHKILQFSIYIISTAIHICWHFDSCQLRVHNSNIMVHVFTISFQNPIRCFIGGGFVVQAFESWHLDPIYIDRDCALGNAHDSPLDCKSDFIKSHISFFLQFQECMKLSNYCEFCFRILALSSHSVRACVDKRDMSIYAYIYTYFEHWFQYISRPHDQTRPEHFLITFLIVYHRFSSSPSLSSPLSSLGPTCQVHLV